MVEESKLAEKFEEKQAETKFNKEEMSKLSDIRETYLQVQYKFGQSAMLRLRLEERVQELNAQVEVLKEEYRKNQKIEQEFLDKINNKYGDGSLNPDSGIFTPTTEKNS